MNCGREHSTHACLEHVTNARLVAAYGIAFFDRYLKGQPASILDQHKTLEIAEFLSK